MIEMKIQFFYRKNTLQIDAVYKNCKTNSTKFKDKTVYTEVNVSDPAYKISRNHKVIIKKGKIIGTKPSVNPIQPNIINDVPTKLKLKSPDGSIYEVGIDDTGKLKTVKTK